MTDVMEFARPVFADDDVMSVADSLRGYLRAVASTLGVSLESCAINPYPPASAYVAVDVKLTRYPGQDVALTWDERRGWSAVVESDFGQKVRTIARCGGDVTPEPAVVQDFVDALVAGTKLGDARLSTRRGRRGSLVSRLRAHVS